VRHVLHACWHLHGGMGMGCTAVLDAEEMKEMEAGRKMSIQGIIRTKPLCLADFTCAS